MALRQQFDICDACGYYPANHSYLRFNHTPFVIYPSSSLWLENLELKSAFSVGARGSAVRSHKIANKIATKAIVPTVEQPAVGSLP